MTANSTNDILEELRRLFSTPRHTTAERMLLAELFNQLDSILSAGGMLPIAWIEATKPQLRVPNVTHLCHCGREHELPMCRRS